MWGRGLLWGDFFCGSPFLIRLTMSSALRLIPFSAGPTLPSPLAPWHDAHFDLKSVAPSAQEKGEETSVKDRTSSPMASLLFIDVRPRLLLSDRFTNVRIGKINRATYRTRTPRATPSAGKK